MWKASLLVVMVLLLNRSSSKTRVFPEGFKWGASTSAYQIEGGWNTDGKGLSIMDVFTKIKPASFSNDTGDVACDSYHKWQEDVALLKDLGVKTYRMSIAWSRILPTGTTNVVNQAGIIYYINFLKTLKENGIEPYVTLLHFDTPALTVLVNKVFDKTYDVKAFADYARICFENFGKYVKYWFTVNEFQSYAIGDAKFFDTNIYQFGKELLLAHAEAWHLYDKEFRPTQHGKIAPVLNSDWFLARDPSKPDDIKAANSELQFTLGWFAHPIYFGKWPQAMIDRIGNLSKEQGLKQSRLPELTQEESDTIKGTSDFFALNHYGSHLVEFTDGTSGENLTQYEKDKGTIWSQNASWTCPNLEGPASQIYACANAPGFRNLLNYINKTYKPSEIIITENGWPDSGGILDLDRIGYYMDYLGSLWEAIHSDHIPVTTYQTWSLLDNFEWTYGYKIKFGLVDVDFNAENRTRTPKFSFNWYKKVVAANSLDIDLI